MTLHVKHRRESNLCAGGSPGHIDPDKITDHSRFQDSDDKHCLNPDPLSPLSPLLSPSFLKKDLFSIRTFSPQS